MLTRGVEQLGKQWRALARSASTPVPFRLPPAAFPVVILCLSTLIIAMIFVAGVRRGMDHVTMFGPEGEQTAISVALSESVYGIHLGYVGLANVRDKLVEVWNKGAKDGHDPILIKNDSNRDLLNGAIKAAASLGPQTPGDVGDRTLITTVYDDMGYVDYVKLAFRLFGQRIESLYYTFFLLLGLSVLAFVWTFRDSITPQIVLLCTLFAFYIELHTAIFTPGMPTFYGMRHGSTLALVPMWYLAFAILQRKRLTFGNAIAVAIEAAIMILSFRMRGSSSWTMILVLGTAFATAFIPWCRRPPRERSGMRLVRATAPWPALLLVGAFFANGVYDDAVLHPVYFTDDVMPYHGLWHSAVLGISLEPNLLDPEVAAKLRKGSIKADSLDSIGWYEALDYLKRSHFLEPNANPAVSPVGYISPWTGTYKTRLHDNIMRRVFFDIVLHHPLGVARLYLWVKPALLIDCIRLLFEYTPGHKWLYLIVGAGIGISILMVLSGAFARERVALTLLAYASALLASTLPNLWAYASFATMADNFLMLLGFVTFAIGMTIALAFHATWQLATHASGRLPVGEFAPDRTLQLSSILQNCQFSD
jgi:hypothetical protein